MVPIFLANQIFLTYFYKETHMEKQMFWIVKIWFRFFAWWQINVYGLINSESILLEKQ